VRCKEDVVRKLDRREFMIGAGGAALAAASPATAFAQPAAPNAAARLAARRPVGTMQPNDPALASYRLAVERMKALPANDPRNWNRVAQIHVDFCPHGNWFFLPWHRAYLVAFERICRQMSGDPNFALPYWDWTAQPQMPPAFTSSTIGGRRNPLFDGTRQMRPGASLRASAVGPQVISRIMAETSFEMFGSTRPTGQNSTDARWLRAPGRTTLLEGGPHNTTHSAVGGDMGDMASPRDPIFWLHHCNVDRLWARWNALGRRNISNRLWATFPFNGMFQVPQGRGLTAFNVSVRDMLDHRAWGYTYPDLPPRNEAAVVAESDFDLPEPRVLASEAARGGARVNSVLSTRMILLSQQNETTVRIPEAGSSAGRTTTDLLREEAPTPTDHVSAPASAPRLPDGRIFSVLESVNASGGDATTVNVFLNSPNPTANPAEDDPHFVGTFGLFGLQSHAAHGGLSVQLELTETIARMRQANRTPSGHFDVQLIPVEAQGDNLELKLNRINIVTL
jgi:tyrosinase